MVTVNQPTKRGKRAVPTVANIPCPICGEYFSQAEFAGYDYQFGFYCDDCGNEMQPEDAREYAFDFLNRYTDNY